MKRMNYIFAMLLLFAMWAAAIYEIVYLTIK